MRRFGLLRMPASAALVVVLGACPAPTDDGGAEGPASGAETASGSATQGNTSTGTDTSGADGTSTAGTTGGLGGVCVGALSDSFVAWEAARDGADNNYTFAMWDNEVFADQCTGDVYLACQTLTTLVVSGGIVVERTFEVNPSDDIPPEDCPEPYTETGDEVGSHADGYPPVTFDGVYQSCCDLAEMEGGYLTEYFGEDYSPGDLVVTIGDDSLIEKCTRQVCDDCGCQGGVDIEVASVTFG